MSKVDFHTHILPCVDDGSHSIERSIAMLESEAEQGIETIVLTPHFYANHDSPKRFFERRNNAVRQLTDAIAERNDLPRLIVGAEVHYFEGMSDSEYLSELAIGSTGTVMVEMPMNGWSERMFKDLEAIHQKSGLTPIVAHIDRYIAPLRTRGIPERLATMPVLVQANASFFLNRSTRGLAIKLLRKERIHLLGSDCHNLSSRPPNIGETLDIIRKRLGDESLERIQSIESNLIGES